MILFQRVETRLKLFQNYFARVPFVAAHEYFFDVFNVAEIVSCCHEPLVSFTLNILFTLNVSIHSTKHGDSERRQDWQ